MRIYPGNKQPGTNSHITLNKYEAPGHSGNNGYLQKSKLHFHDRSELIKLNNSQNHG